MAGRKAASIDAYLADVKPDQKAALQRLRRIIAKVAPRAEECISYGIPAFRQDGRMLVAFAAFRHHCSLFPYSSSLLPQFEKEISAFETSKGTIRFQPARPLPVALVRAIVKRRLDSSPTGKKRRAAR